MKQKHILRPFLSTNSVILIAVFLMCVGQIITMLGICIRLSSPSAKDEFALIWKFRDILNVAIPLYLVSLIADLLRDKTKITKHLIMYLALAIIFYVAEILIFYTVIQPFANGIASYYINQNPEGLEAVTSIINITSVYALSYFSNMNVFLDLFVVTLFAFFIFSTPKSKKLLIAFRCLSIIPILYFLASFIIYGLFKNGYFVLTIEQASFLLHRNYLSFIFFFLVIIYQKYRERLYMKFRKKEEISFDEYKKSAKGLYLYNMLLIGTLSFLVLVDFLLGLIPDSSSFGIGHSYVLLFSLPILVFFNSERKVHIKTSYALKFSLYAILGVILVAGYIAVFGHALAYIDNYLGFLRQ